MDNSERILKNSPSYTLDLSTMSKPNDIVKFCRRHSIKYYVYTFIDNSGSTPQVMKYGYSYPDKGDSKSQRHGDRVKRQAHYIPGWSTPPPRSGNSSDMRNIVEEHFPTIYKDDVLLVIVDLGMYTENTVRSCESWLINEHKEAHGESPAGNYRDETGRLYNPEHIFEQMFEDPFERVFDVE